MMAKISSYINGSPSLSDKILGTSVIGLPANATENFTLQSILDLFIPKLTTAQINAIVSPIEGSHLLREFLERNLNIPAREKS